MNGVLHLVGLTFEEHITKKKIFFVRGTCEFGL